MRRALADALSDTSKIVFTHNDLSPRNIIVVGNRVEGLLDWEYTPDGIPNTGNL
jgi:aminoglycoside phosphotransferase (APT) family kinase protein